MYFAITTLSTTGFGDFYPRNSLERLLCSFMLLGGVSIFSYMLGELRWMVENIQVLNGEDLGCNEEMEEFFLLLKKFNKGQHIPEELQSQIRQLMNDKYKYDKNNFLITNSDRMLLEQLPSNC